MTTWEVLGWVGNACFFSRFFIQWLASERARRSVAPTSFWWLSLCGSLMIGAYSIHRGEPVLLIGSVINGSIFARNLWLARPRDGRRLGLATSTLLAAMTVLAVLLLAATRAPGEWGASPLWVACVVAGQGVWSSRFVVQWWFAERGEGARFPTAFWLVSLTGNLLLLTYALHLGDAVYIAGFVLGPFIQVRNLVIEAKARRRGDSRGEVVELEDARLARDASGGPDLPLGARESSEAV